MWYIFAGTKDCLVEERLVWVALESREGTVCFVLWGAGFGSLPRTFCVPVKAYKTGPLDLFRKGKRD